MERLCLVSQSCLGLRADGALKLILMRVDPAASNNASPGQTRQLAVEFTRQRHHGPVRPHDNYRMRRVPPRII
jgi:hypothetical protein